MLIQECMCLKIVFFFFWFLNFQSSRNRMLIFERKKNKFVRNIGSFDSRVRKLGGKMSDRSRFDGKDCFGLKNRFLLVPEFSKIVRPNVNFWSETELIRNIGSLESTVRKIEGKISIVSDRSRSKGNDVWFKKWGSNVFLNWILSLYTVLQLVQRVASKPITN